MLEFFRSRNFFPTMDWVLLGATLPLLIAGLFTMDSFVGDNYFFIRQVIWIGVALLTFFGLSLADWRILRRTEVVTGIYIFGLFTLIIILPLCPTS